MLALSPAIVAAVSAVLSTCTVVAAAPFPPTEVGTTSQERPPTEFPEPTWQKKLAIYSSDGKVDDNLAMALGSRVHHYDEALVFHDGVALPAASMVNTEFIQRFLESQGGAGAGSVTQRHHFKGASPFKDEDGSTTVMDHERHFIDPNVVYGQEVMEYPTLHSPAELDDHLSQFKGQKRKADFFSQSPVPYSVLQERIALLKKNGIKLENFHHILGYNTRQDSISKKAASPATQEFATQLQAMVKHYYPKANVIFTNSYHNLEGPPGATQDYTRLEKILPPHASAQIGRLDTFFLKQMRAIYDDLVEKKLDPAPFLGLDGKPITQKGIWRARLNDPRDGKGQRLHDLLLEAAEVNLAKLEEGSNLESRMKSVIAGFVGPCQGEACDFNHQAIVHAAIHKAQTDPHAFQPVKLGKNIRMQLAKPGETIHALSPNPDMFTKHTAADFLQRYLEQHPGSGQDGASGSSSAA